MTGEGDSAGSLPARRALPRRLEILFEDEHLHAVNKPSGLSTSSERWDHAAPTAIDRLWREWLRIDPGAPRPHVIHRLDKATTGVLLFARHREAQAEVRRQFREREVEKSYLALVRGIPSPAEGVIEIGLEEDTRSAGRMRVLRKGGKPSITGFETVEALHGLSWLRLRPRTGRTHQIRVTLAHIGHPCVADPLYGDGAPLYLSDFKRRYRAGRGKEERPLLGRLALHAERLELRHPATGEPFAIEAPLARDLAATLRQLRRWGSG